MKNAQKHPVARLVAIAYLVGIAAFLLIGFGRLAKGAYYEHKGLRVHETLGFADLESLSMKPFETDETGEWYVSTDSDPQFHLKKEMYLEKVELNLLQKQEGFAAVLYWKEPGQADFSEVQSVYAKETEPGHFVFDLKGKRVSEIRVDPDSAGGVVTRMDGLVLNPESGFWEAFHLGAKQLLMLLVLPLFAAAFWLEGKAVFKKKTGSA